jgi:membrane protease subunit HflC
MKNVAITIFIILLLAILVLYLVVFQVRETESALVIRFGEPIRTIVDPDWYLKLPFPIDLVRKFDSRMRVFEVTPDETTTKGAVPIIVNTYVVWRIADPLKFHNAVGTVREAENKLRGQIKDAQNRVVGRHFFSEFVNSDPAKIKFEQIEEEMRADLSQAVQQEYGIEITMLGIKQLKLSKAVSKDVFERMKAERNRRTEETIATGTAEATKLTADAERKKTEILAVAEARARAVRGQGDAEAAKYYELLQANPDLAMFLRETEALRRILKERATYVVPADVAPFRLLKEMPAVEPGEPNQVKK